MRSVLENLLPDQNNIFIGFPLYIEMDLSYVLLFKRETHICLVVQIFGSDMRLSRTSWWEDGR